MAAQSKEIEEQLKQILWSPNSESSGETKKKTPKRQFGGKYKKASKQSDDCFPSDSNEKVSDKNAESDTIKAGVPWKILTRKDAKNTDDNYSVNKLSPGVGTSNARCRSPKVGKQNKTLPLDFTLGEKEDIGQPIDRGNKSQRPSSQSKAKKGEGKQEKEGREKKTSQSKERKTEGKVETESSEKKKPKKKKPVKKLKIKKKDDNEENSDAHSNKATREEESPGVQTTKIDPDLTPEIQSILEAEFVFQLKKKSPKFPLARYYCRLCDYHCDNVSISQKHIKDTRHKRLSLIRATDIMLKSLPDPSEEHCNVVNKVITQIFEKYGLSEEEIKKRNQVLTQLYKVISPRLPGVKLTVYGSTATGFGLKDSDLNIDLASEAPAANLAEIYIILREDKSGLFHQLRSDFSSKIPSVLFKTPSLGNIQVQLGINSTFACQTTKLLATYYEIDHRLAVLATAFRYWAKLVKVDKQECGTLPAYVFHLMTVYYLQQCSPPVLPVLHQLKHPFTEDTGKPKQCKDGYFDQIKLLSYVWECENHKQVGELWIGMLKFYAVDFDVVNHILSIREKKPMNRNEKKWTSKRIAIEDPYMRKRNVAKSVSHSHIYEYIDDRLRAAYLYFGNPQTRNGPLFTHADVGQLQTKLHENLKHKYERNQCSTSSPSPVAGKSGVTEVTCQDSSKILESSISDSEEKSEKTKCGKSIPGDLEEFVEKMGKTVLASAISAVNNHMHSKQNGEKLSHNDDSPEVLEKCMSSLLIEDSVKSENIVDVAENKSQRKIRGRDSESEQSETEDVPDNHAEMSEESEESDEESDEEEEDPETKGDVDKDLKNSSVCSPAHTKCNGGIEGLYDESLLHGLQEEDFVYKFDEGVLYDGKGPAVMCQVCQKEGHLKMACPEENLPPLEPLPPMTPEYEQLLDQVLWRVPADFQPSSRELHGRMEVLRQLEDYIREFYSDAKLEAFGSSCNGFGFRESDLDLCLTFTKSDPKDMDFVEIIEDLAKKLKKHKGLYQVIAITSAKVPIVKFKHRAYQVEGDISLYNTLGIHNTKMLYMYSQIDQRVQALGYIMKVFAKICDIGDASRGSLSSYAYIILVLYYLQQRKPPVLPVLQEIHDDKKPTVMVDGWNAWFYDDFKTLPKKWPGWGKNQESLASLWIGLLKFFTEEFNFKDYVVCIRQHKPLTRFEKLWNGKGLTIEDPFDLSHNLGGGVSRKMSTFIRKTVRNGCVLHGTPLDAVPWKYRTLLDYLFDKELLSDTQPPNDRGCRVCGKIGHFAKECPVVINRKERQAKERQEKEMIRQMQQQHEAEARQRKQQQTHHPMDALVVSDRDYWIQQDLVASRRRNNSVDSNGGISIPGGGRQRYQRSYSQGTPPSNSNGSPRVSPYVYMYPCFTAPNNLTSPTSGYRNNSPGGGHLTWQQEQMMQSPQQHQPHGSVQYGRHQSHPAHVYPSSPSFYQSVIPVSPSQQQQQGRWHHGSPGRSGHPFIPQHAVKSTGLPTTSSNSKRSSQSSQTSPSDRVVHSNPAKGDLEITITNKNETTKSKAAEKSRRRRELQKKRSRKPKEDET